MPISYSSISGSQSSSDSPIIWYSAVTASGATYGTKLERTFDPGYYKIEIYPNTVGSSTTSISGNLNFILEDLSTLSTPNFGDLDSGSTTNPLTILFNLESTAIAIYSTSLAGQISIQRVGEKLRSLTGNLSTRTTSQSITIGPTQTAQAVMIGGGGGGGGGTQGWYVNNGDCGSNGSIGAGGGGSGYRTELIEMGPGTYNFVSGAGVNSGTAGTSYLSGGTLTETISAAGGNSAVGLTGGTGGARGNSSSYGGNPCYSISVSYSGAQAMTRAAGAYFQPVGGPGSSNSHGAGGGGGFAQGGSNGGSGSQGSGGSGPGAGGSGALAIMIWS